jgi:hypothetical protein
VLRVFSSPKCPDGLRGLPNLLFRGYWGAEWLGCEVDHSPSAEVKNKWSYTSPPFICVCLHGVERDNFIFCKKVAEMLYKVTSIARALFSVLQLYKHWLPCGLLLFEEKKSLLHRARPTKFSEGSTPTRDKMWPS